jgi:deazaflavin-dependent oxidoreductase (nitroreductase family)
MGWNDDLIADYRAHGKPTKGPFVGKQVLLLTTKGKKSGEERTVPLVYTKEDDHYVIVASKGGAPTSPDWFHNLRTDPTVTVEVGRDRFKARANVAAPESERERLYAEHAKVFPGFLDYVKRTTRKIPVVKLERVEPGPA